MSKSDETQSAKHRSPFLVTFTAGGISGTVGAIITCPLEVVKTRFQSSQYQAAFANEGGTMTFRAPFRLLCTHIGGTLIALRSVYLNEGITALWKGVGATIIGVMPSRAIYFSTYNLGKSRLTEVNGGHETSLVHLGAAVTAGIATATATNPIWLIKTRMQLQEEGQRVYKNSWDCARKVVEGEGFKGLYKGLTASYLGVAEGTLQWVLYEKMKKMAGEYRKRQNAAYGVVHYQGLGWLDYFGLAATSKLIAACITYPHEVLRTRLREMRSLSSNTPQKYRGLLQTARLILREEGVTAFYGGMTAHLMRVVPNSAIMFFCYEALLQTHKKYSEDLERQ